jgi:uncharacterized protein (TIGR02300 family)
MPAARARPEPVAAAMARAPTKEPEIEVPEVQEAEFVSLEEADAETEGAKKAPGDDVEADDDVELDESLDDAAFIEEQEEGDADVTDIIGDRENEEET